MTREECEGKRAVIDYTDAVPLFARVLLARAALHSGPMPRTRGVCGKRARRTSMDDLVDRVRAADRLRGCRLGGQRFAALREPLDLAVSKRRGQLVGFCAHRKGAQSTTLAAKGYGSTHREVLRAVRAGEKEEVLVQVGEDQPQGAFLGPRQDLRNLVGELAKVVHCAK